MQAPAVLGESSGAIRAEIQKLLQGRDQPLYSMVRYHLGWVDVEGRPREGAGGKGLRSTLCLESTRAVGGDPAQAVPAAAALELVHEFSLVHDDIQDGSPQRRHRPTVWSVWGEAQAINVGDCLFALAHQALWGLISQEVSPQKVARLALLLDETCLRLCEGQSLDLAFQSRLDISVGMYFEMIERKTGALIEAACLMGALLGTEREQTADCLRRAGHHLGCAFQIRDDILGVWGVPETLGKPVAEDLWSRKKSLPVIMAFSHAGATQRRLLEEIYSSDSLGGESVERLLQLFDELRVQQRCQEMAEAQCNAVLAQLDSAELEGTAAAPLKDMARFAVARDV